MKRILIFLIVLLIISCDSTTRQLVKKTVIKKNNNIIYEKKKENVINENKIALDRNNEILDKFNGVIEDFEKNLHYWTYSKTQPASLNRISMDNGASIGQFVFEAPYCKEEYHPNINHIFYSRKMDFNKYKGIRFMAKGEGAALYKIKILEKEEYYPGKNVNEVWYKVFRVNGDWQEYKILFKEMQVEEYWEQNYISDNIQVFTNVIGISITAQNMSIRDNIKGVLFIDNIELY